jgi:hypothetical protein
MVRKKLPEPGNMRSMLLKVAMDMEMSSKELYELTLPMRGKAEEEREAMAAEIVERL